MDTATIRMLIDIPSHGILTVDGCLYSTQIRNGEANYCRIDLLPSSTLYLWNQLENLEYGHVRLFDGTRIKCDNPDPYFPHIMNYTGGLIEVIADTAGGVGQAEINAQYEEFWHVGGQLSLVSGNLLLSAYSCVTDSVCIAPSCTLLTDTIVHFGVNYGAISGTGTIHCRTSTVTISGPYWFTGSVLLTGTLQEPAFMELHPLNNEYIPAPHIRTLGLLTRYATFRTFALRPVSVDTLIFLGGKIHGRIDTSGASALTEIAERAVVEAPMLTVLGDAPKDLDSLHLIVTGPGTLEGAGTLTMIDSATIEVRETGSLQVGPGFTMEGVGLLYNSGSIAFDPQGDTITVDVPIENHTTARTPGTIDILDAPVSFGGPGWNGAGLNLAPSSSLILNADFINEGGGAMTLGDSSILMVNDTLLNEGLIMILGGALMGGNGIIVNNGTISRPGSPLATTGNAVITAWLNNLSDSGVVNVMGDTLTFAGGGTNAGEMHIETGTVLRIQGTFTNLPTGVIHGGGVLDVSGATFVNEGTINIWNPVTDVVVRIIGNDVVLNWTHEWPASYVVYSSATPEGNFTTEEATTTDTTVTLVNAAGASTLRFYTVVANDSSLRR